MKPIRRLIAVAAVAATPLLVAVPVAHAQAPGDVTLTFRLTLTGTVPSHDVFLVTFPVNGSQFCGPCVGGQTYVVTIPWGQSTTAVPFRFVREDTSACTPMGQGSSSCPPSAQHIFATVDVTPTHSQTINGFFAYGTAAATGVSVPATGAVSGVVAGSALIAAGAGLGALAAWRRRRR